MVLQLLINVLGGIRLDLPQNPKRLAEAFAGTAQKEMRITRKLQIGQQGKVLGCVIRHARFLERRVAYDDTVVVGRADVIISIFLTLLFKDRVMEMLFSNHELHILLPVKLLQKA